MLWNDWDFIFKLMAFFLRCKFFTDSSLSALCTLMDALELLTRDHQKVRELFHQAETMEQSKTRRIFRQIKRELEAHLRIEEGIFYPAIEHRDELKGALLDSQAKNRQVKTLLAKINILVSQNKPFALKFKLLEVKVKRRDEEEERKIFPQVRSVIDDATLKRLGQQFQVAKGS